MPNKDSTVAISIPTQIRILLSVSGTILIISTAFLLDWAIDSFSKSDWDKIDEIAEDMGEKKFNRGANFIYARLRLFGGGYFLLSLALGSLVFTMLWLTQENTRLNDGGIATLLSNLVAAFCSLGIVIKMMTRTLGNVAWSIIIVGGLAIISIILNVVYNI